MIETNERRRKMEMQTEYQTQSAEPAPVLARATEIERQAMSLVERAQAIEIADDDGYRAAGGFLLRIKELRSHVAELWNPVIKKAHEAHRAALESKAKLDAPLDQAERTIKPKLAAYDEEQRRRAEEARRVAEAEARRVADEIRRKAEAEAAEIRRKAEEARAEAERLRRKAEAEAAEAQRKAEEARRRAEEEDRKRSAKARAEAEAARCKAEAEAAQARAKAEEAWRKAEAEAAEARRMAREADEAEGQAMVAPAPVPVAPVEAPTAIKGVSYAENWKAEVTNLKALLKGILEGIVPITAVQPDQSVLDKAAKAMKEHMTWPGVRAYMERVTRAGRRVS